MPKRVKKVLKKKKKIVKKRAKPRTSKVVLARGARVRAGPTSRLVGPSTQLSAHQNFNFPKTYYTIEKYNDVKNGIHDGIKLKWCGPVYYFNVATSGGSQLYNGNYNVLGNNSANYQPYIGFEVNPYFVLPYASVAAVAEAYSRFSFRSLKMHYNGMCSSGSAFALAMGYDPDGSFLPSDLHSYGQMMSLPANTYFPAWTAQSIDYTPWLNQKDWFYTDWDSGITDAGYRESYQGIALMHVNAAIQGVVTGAVDIGMVYSEGELWMHGSYPFAQNYAIKNRQEKVQLKRTHDLQRKPKNEAKTESKTLVETPVDGDAEFIKILPRSRSVSKSK